MVAEYTIVPYLITIYVKFERRDHILPLGNINGEGLALSEAVGRVLLDSYESDRVFTGGEKGKRKYTLSALEKGARCFYFDVKVSTSGIRSLLVDEHTREKFHRRTSTPEQVTLRHWLMFPEGGKHAILLAERCGNTGAISFVEPVLKQTFRRHLPKFTLDVRPMTSLGAVKSASFREIRFRAPMPRDPSGKLLNSAPEMVVTAKYKGGKSIKSLIDSDGKIDPFKVFGVLSDGLDSGSAQGYNDAKWSASIGLELPSGHRRSFKVGESEGPSLVYSVEVDPKRSSSASSASNDPGYPTSEEFRRSCGAVLDDMAGLFALTPDSKDSLNATALNLEDLTAERWTVVWHDAPAPGTNS